MPDTRPTDTHLKRTTVLVNDCSSSIAFYRDVLGMKEYYNQTMLVGGKIIPAGEPGAEVHLGIMEGNRSDIAKLGILEWTGPRLPENPGFADRSRLAIGDVVFVCETPDMDPLIERLSASSDCRMHCPPHDWAVPSPDGKGEIQMTTLSFFDPDGLFFEVNSKRNMPNIDAFGIKRTTLIVRDIQKSVDFYATIMGMKVWYDQEMPVGGEVLPAGEPGAQVRVVILQGNDSEVGMLGLMQYLDPPVGHPGPYAKTIGIGTAMFVASAEDVTVIAARMAASEAEYGHTIHCPPDHDEVPGADGKTIQLTTMSFFDPDGYFYELNTRKEVG
ncbi:MAG: VOC family protein [Rhodospirillaceae bacterium]|jgi:catechol 2,3-dioxygenase-like lactoylglutathione lyase family enzyme|nr:VOC family protein [Rhodospirillaceae bacterium]